ncbi:hypothetical protein PI95_004430 [Hassallia byssoidea VB512170]|uniref:Uncharacterized protein n=1 Tax=Hassallia byssoidea VB512170 TaxID=1304833 RepID=A0A846H5G7_9CYAN|nr:hypothetical protein [Hassalia byssoidea]NEU71841.1 hypothetical protein [Hassalia byssoidea VB512170]
MDKPRYEFRTVNRILGEQPRLGPFPADQIVPWSAIALIMYMVVKGFMQQSWFATGIAIAWGWATWWTVSSNKAFFGKFVGTPRLSRGYKPFESLVNPPRSEPKKKRKPKKRTLINSSNYRR